MTHYTGRSHLSQGSRAGIAVAAMALSVFLTGFSLNPFSSNAPVLMLLEHPESGKPVQTKIEVKAGLVTSPEKGKPQAKWIIRAGDALKAGSRPGDRSVGFYQGANAQSTLLFIVKVRYYQNAAGRWEPRFLLNEEPLVIKKDGRWQPLTAVQGVPNLIVQTGSVLPNAEGYLPSLEFGLSTGAMSIDAWQVQ